VLASLSIEGLALVESVEISFDPGLNVLTGETGAGKSLILGSIGLLLGERADPAWVRSGSDRGSAEGELDLSGRPDLLEALAALDADSEEGRVILRREVSADGKSRAFVNGRSVLAGRLKEIGDLLVDLHGQHEHQLLLRPERQAEFFDGWAGLLGERRALEAARESLIEERRSLRDARDRWERERAEGDAAREDLAELRAASLAPEEEDALKRSRERAIHRERLLQGLAETRALLSGEDTGATDRIRRAVRTIRSIATLDGEMETLAGEGDRVLDAIGELESGLDRAEERLQEGSLDVESLEARLDLLHRLKRKHRTDLRGLITLRESLEARESAFDPSGRALEEAERAHDERLQAYERRLDALSAHRADRFAPFEREVGARLGRLGFGKASLRVAAVPSERSRAAIDPTAIPDLEFAFRPNPGEGERPLRRIASGGELSRVMLAIKSIMAERDRVAVLIFDEVDQGIGGGAAQEVGRLLRMLGTRRQVLCITHLPLIAAHGARHFQVTKTSRGGRTATSVRPLDPSEREREVARLLAGDRATETTRRQARELLASASPESGPSATPVRRAARRGA
jgi:DNA repair protein RecN (Recombination protein N)